MSPLFFIPPLILLAYLTYRNTNYGIYIVLATIPGYLLRTAVAFVPTTWLELAIYTVAAVSLYKHLRKKTLAPHFYYALHHARRYVVPVLLFTLAALVSVSVSPNPARALGIMKAWFFAPLIFAILLLDKLTNETITRRVCYALSLSALPIILYGLVEYAGDFGMSIPGRLDSFFESPNYVAMYLVPLTLLLGGYMVPRKGGNGDASARHLQGLYARTRVVYSSVWLVLGAATIIFTKSFGGWLGLFGGLIFLAIFYKRVTMRKLVILALLSFALLILGFLGYQQSKTHYNAFWRVNSLETRTEVWTHAFTMLARSPVIGVGIGGFHDAYAAYIATLPEDKQPVEKDVLWPHNIYLTVWVESGVVALAAFIWILLILFREVFHAYFVKHSRAVLAPAAAMMSIVLHGLVDTPYLKNDLSLLFWVIVVIAIVSGEQGMERKRDWHR